VRRIALAANTITAARRLGFTGQRFPVVLAGSVFVHSALLRELFTAAVMAVLPGAMAFLPERDAATGAADDGARSAGCEPATIYPRLVRLIPAGLPKSGMR